MTNPLLAPGRPLAIGCMRLSTAADRDDERSLAVLRCALDAGVTLLDTADAYCRHEGERGHNERLIARVLADRGRDGPAVLVATKGGLTRPDGRWVADGRARHLRDACLASRRALGVERIGLYQLHAPDPRAPLATSVRALAALQKEGAIAAIGLCNVSLGQLEEAQRVAEIASVQVELSPFAEQALRGGVAERCAAHGIALLAHRPLGGAARRARLEADPLLRELAEKHAATPQLIALAWLRSLSEALVPLPGPTVPESARSLAPLAALRLDESDLERLDRRFPAGRVLRLPRAARRPAGAASGEVVLVIGLPGAGKSTLADRLVADGYLRLNRDERGGRLGDLLAPLRSALAGGRRRVVLDNTYGSRAARNAVLETAWEAGVPVRCLWLTTSLEEAQRNAVQRLLARHGRLLGPEELRAAGRHDPGAFDPSVQLRHSRSFEPPRPDEGFSALEEVAFERREPAGRSARAVMFWYDGVVRGARSGMPRPAGPGDVVALPGRGETLRGWQARGYLLLGLAWHPELEAGAASAEEVEATFRRTHELLGVEADPLYCPHADGPPRCWCRRPLPGLGLLHMERRALDAGACLYVGAGAADRALARRIGVPFREADDFFAAAAAP